MMCESVFGLKTNKKEKPSMFSKDHNEYLWVFLPGLELKLLLTKQEQLWFHIKQIKNKNSFCHFFISLFLTFFGYVYFLFSVHYRLLSPVPETGKNDQISPTADQLYPTSQLVTLL